MQVAWHAQPSTWMRYLRKNWRRTSADLTSMAKATEKSNCALATIFCGPAPTTSVALSCLLLQIKILPLQTGHFMDNRLLPCKGKLQPNNRLFVSLGYFLVLIKVLPFAIVEATLFTKRILFHPHVWQVADLTFRLKSSFPPQTGHFKIIVSFLNFTSAKTNKNHILKTAILLKLSEELAFQRFL